MKLTNIQIDAWDGTEYIVLHQAVGFYFSERRFVQGILTNDYCFLFNKNIVLGDEEIEMIKKMLEHLKSKKDNLKNEILETPYFKHHPNSKIAKRLRTEAQTQPSVASKEVA